MKKIIFTFLSISLLGCNSYKNKMNKLLEDKSAIELRIDSDQVKENHFRQVTGYDEIYDSITINKQYPHPELVDSIRDLKNERQFLNEVLIKLRYSIDSLQKLR